MRYLIIATILLSACGDDLEQSSSSSSEINEFSQAVSVEESEEGELLFEGYISNAFEVSVDGLPYDDLEDFYTQESENLKEKVIAAGYDESYEVFFDAEIGFKDLWQNMTVYISSVQNRGYQREAYVGHNGDFSIALPTKAEDSEYKVRANKRIGVILSNEHETIRICYNFSAIDKSVLLSEKEQPIILNEFQSKITNYACEKSENSAIEIPVMEQDDAEIGIKIAPGMSKKDVLDQVGEDFLLIESETKWCWFSDSFGASHLCAANYATVCQCYITFDEEGYVDGKDNIKSKYLDILSW
ncbi:MAG: hypothetical protein AB8G05_05485 [Oligoflexales bacterium]